MKTISVAILCIFIICSTFSQIPIFGPHVSGTWVKTNSPYLIYGNVTILSDSMLTIESGVEIVFQDEYLFTVEGNLQANGIEADSVRFTVQDTTGYTIGAYTGWDGFKFYNSSGTSLLTYCIIEYSCGDGIYSEYSGLEIENSLIRNNNSAGIFIVDGSDLILNNSVVEENKGDGINVIYHSSLNATNTTTKNNLNRGVFISSSCNVSLMDFNSESNEGVGVEIELLHNDGSVIYSGGNVSNNLNGGFRIYNQSDNITLENLGVFGNYKSGNGGGISLTGDEYFPCGLVGRNLDINYNNADFGGGIYCNRADLILESIDLEYNEAVNSGGGIYSLESNVEMDTVEFQYNICSQSGGGMYSKLSQLDLVEVDFIAGLGYDGSGLYCDSTDYEMTSGMFSGNTMYNYGGGLYQSSGTGIISGVEFNGNAGYPGFGYAASTGGGIYCSGANLTLTDISFTGNYAFDSGGGIYSLGSILDLNNVEFSGCNNNQGGGGGGMLISGSPVCNLTDVIISNCYGTRGGGLRTFGSNIFMTNMQIRNNSCQDHGGGIYCSSSTLSFSNVEISGNNSSFGAGIYSSNSTLSMLNAEIFNNAGSVGGGIYSESSTTLIEKTLIYDNYALYGGGLYLNNNSNCEILNTTIVYDSIANGTAIYADVGSSANIVNSVIWGHPSPVFDGTGVITATYSNIQGSLYPGIGNITSDSWFVDPLNADFNLSWINFPIPDVTKSPCIDTGDPASPKDPDSTRADMGAYYFEQYCLMDIKVFLEGPFFYSMMIPYLNIAGHIPLSQPYHELPWNYNGVENVPLIPDGDIVDWLLVEFYDNTMKTTDANASSLGNIAVFVLNDGSIVGMDGTALPRFYTMGANDVYFGIWHRNHLGVLSALPATLNGRTYSYDFTNAEDKAYGGAQAQKQLNTNIWGMIAADGNADGQVNNIDKDDSWYLQLYNAGYLSGDFNMDSQVNQIDKDNFWAPNCGVGSAIP